jgi:hypothetical protein
MSDNSAFGFGKFVPGFDFLQSLAQSASRPSAAGSAIPGMSNWVAPTLSVEELDKRIQELKAVQFWLEQNGTALKATIQALEVQKMTLTTLQGMNVNMSELAKAFTARAPEQTSGAASATAAGPTPAPEPTPEPVAKTAPKPKSRTKPETSKPTASATVDPMQWWGSLTQQFQNIASSAMQDVAAQAVKAQDAASAAAGASPQARTPAKTSAAPAKATRKKPAVKKTRAGQVKG